MAKKRKRSVLKKDGVHTQTDQKYQALAPILGGVVILVFLVLGGILLYRFGQSHPQNTSFPTPSPIISTQPIENSSLLETPTVSPTATPTEIPTATPTPSVTLAPTSTSTPTPAFTPPTKEKHRRD